MAGTIESVSTINSFLRTLIAIVVLGGAGTAGWYGFTAFNAKELEAQAKAKLLAEAEGKLAQAESDLTAAKADIVAKAATIDKLNVEVEKLNTSLKLLKVDHRVAKLTVLDQTKDDATGQTTTTVEFVELNDEGQPIDAPRKFSIPGDTVYVDGWVVKFDDKYIESADLERGTSLIVFKRLFGSNQKPDEGFPLDKEGAAPTAYARGGQMSDFERKIFDDFWSIANDDAKAAELGIRAAHGDAPYIKAQKGKTYKILLRASDGPSIQLDEPVNR
ncbi:MAG: hypothetical protein SFU86_17975 [Pirellulaceae bacterium]|nr:hypothetical protein [Pirellulaceae bacterium]